jgi:PDZ domain
MISRNALARTTTLALAAALAGCIEPPPTPDMRGAVKVEGSPSTTVPFTFDDNRVFVEVAFRAPDGSARKALAFVNMGAGSFVLTNKLYRELGIGDGRPLAMAIGGTTVEIDPRAVQPEELAEAFTIRINPFAKEQTAADAAKGPGGLMEEYSAPMKVEASIPPGLLQNFQAVFDYGARTMTLAAPGSLKPDGVAVPIRVNPKTGFATLDLVVDGKTYPTVIDDGGSYTAMRGSVVAAWIKANPRRLRSEGGIGESNLTMTTGFEVGAPVVKVQGAALGPMRLDELGAIAPEAGGPLGGLVQHTFWDWYSAKAGEDVDGWIGGNILKSYRVTLDYPDRTAYFLQEQPADTHDLDQAGITLTHARGMTAIAGIAKKNGIDTVAGVAAGDQIVSIDGRPTAAMTRGALLAALHGKPGDRHTLGLKRAGKDLSVDVPVTGF